MADNSNRDLQERRVSLSEVREARFQRAQARRESSSGSTWTPGRVARGVTTRSGTYSGKGTLAALLLVGFVIVGIRLVADANVSDDGTTVKANVMHPQGELGPIPILAALIATFFVLSFVAIGGGVRAKLAVIMAGAIILTLGVRSLDEITAAGTTFGKIGTITAPAPTGVLGDIYGDAGQPGTSTFTATANAASGLIGGQLPTITQGVLSSSQLTQIGEDIGGYLNNLGAGAKQYVSGVLHTFGL